MKIEKCTDVAKKPVDVDGARGVEIRWLISRDDGAANFAMRMFEVQPGGHTPLHRHPFEHEVFVLDGQGVLVYEGVEHKFSQGYVVFVPSDKEHRFRNTGSSLLRFLCLVPMSAT